MKSVADYFRGGIDELIFLSFRYYLGRMTISTVAFARDLAVAYPHLKQSVQILIRRELEDAFDRDDRMRESKKEGMDYWLPLGHDCDREAWEEVRKAYKENSKDGI